MFLLSSWVAVPHAAYGYRPFFSTDAAVVPPWHVELELGLLDVEFERGETSFTIPEVTLNVGVLPRVELVGEFELRSDEGFADTLGAPGVFLKAILRDGVLQESPGPSLAVEIGPTFPTDDPEESEVGFEAVAIASAALGPVLAHLNAGGGLSRSGTALGLWGVIAELPFGGGFRAVTEFTGEAIGGSPPVHGALAGCIWEAEDVPLALDLGVRRGLNASAPDWELTAGLTVEVVL